MLWKVVKGYPFPCCNYNVLGGLDPTVRQLQIRRADNKGKSYQALGSSILCNKGKSPSERSLKALAPKGYAPSHNPWSYDKRIKNGVKQRGAKLHLRSLFYNVFKRKSIATVKPQSMTQIF